MKTRFSDEKKVQVSKRYLELIKTMTPTEALKELGIARSTVVYWCDRYHGTSFVKRTLKDKTPKLIQVPMDLPTTSDPNKKILVFLLENVLSNLKTVLEILQG